MKNVKVIIFNSILMGVMAGIQKSKFSQSKTLHLGIPNPVENVRCFPWAGYLKWQG
jgi:hypothetical protein